MALTQVAEDAMKFREMLVFQSDQEIRHRMTAMALGDYMEKFQYNLFGLETDSLGRSDAKSLLPALQEIKQVCMELELKLVPGESSEERAEAA
jgi:hypothetical protein